MGTWPRGMDETAAAGGGRSDRVTCGRSGSTGWGLFEWLIVHRALCRPPALLVILAVRSPDSGPRRYRVRGARSALTMRTLDRSTSLHCGASPTAAIAVENPTPNCEAIGEVGAVRSRAVSDIVGS